jgi:hypothetical protein
MGEGDLLGHQEVRGRLWKESVREKARVTSLSHSMGEAG